MIDLVLGTIGIILILAFVVALWKIGCWMHTVNEEHHRKIIASWADLRKREAGLKRRQALK